MSPNVWAKEEDAFDKGLTLIGQHQYDKAIQAFSTAIEIIPQDYQAYNYRGVAWALKGNYDRALSDYNKALEIRPRYAEAYNNRGFARTQKGDLPNALNDYTRALKINPFFVDAYNNKAWVLATCADHRFRDGSQAVRLAQKAVELKPDVVSLDTLAAAYAAVGNFDAAVDTQKKAIQKLLLADRNSEVPKYLPHLNAYKSKRSLRINYASRAKTEDPKSKGAKVSLKKQTSKPEPSTTSQKVVAATKSKAQKPAAEPKTKKPAVAESEPSPAVKTQKVATASKTQKPAAEPKTKKPAVAASKPSPAVKTQKTATASKTQKPAAEPKTKKPLAPEIKPLPYTIQVSAYRDPQTSNRVASKLITAGDPAFTTPVDLSEKGKWYRVYIGNYNTLTEAKIAAAGLKNRKFRYVHIAKKPYTVQVGLPVSKSEAQKLKSKLKTKGYLAYSLPAASGQNQTRVLIGAYESRAAAANLAEQLKKDGFDPKIGLR
jgi:Flp pilus assembly protein TadD/cell division septation protein DedD